MATAVGLQTRYRAALAAYLGDGSEAALEEAYVLGRQAVADGLGVLDLTGTHHQALAAIDADHATLIESAGAFLREAMATFEIAARGFTEAAEAARLEHLYAERQRALADASVALNATLEPDEVVAVVAQEARRVLDAAQAEARLEDPVADPVTMRATVDAVDGNDAAGGSLRVPLVARDGRRLGWLRAAARVGRPFDDADEAMLIQLAQMASVAAENARLYARERMIAQTLQRSLLPPRLPEMDGLQVAARYQPAGQGLEVGGDFYDVFAAEAGEWALVIGDVCGKGPEAAAVTALARYTIRAAALHRNQPAAVLRLLSNAMLEQRPDGRFATVAYVRVFDVTSEGARFEIALGGHPPALLLRASGEVESIGRPGTLLGIMPEPRLRTAEAAIAPGDVLLLYTDGVTDVRHHNRELFGLADLQELLGQSKGLGPGAVAARIEEEVLRAAGGRPRDDVAILTLALR